MAESPTSTGTPTGAAPTGSATSFGGSRSPTTSPSAPPSAVDPVSSSVASDATGAKTDLKVTLQFSISAKRLSGTVNGKPFEAVAFSGGGAGGSNRSLHCDPIQNDPDYTHVRSTRLFRSVGRNGLNGYEDAVAVQQMLNASEIAPGLDVDGAVGEKTIIAIKHFQRSIGVTESGLIEPDDHTYDRLRAQSRHHSISVDTDEGRIDCNRGGPPPVGEYIISRDQRPTNTPQIVMKPQFPTNRTGLLMHARGRIGSDGCIVVEDSIHLRTLANGLDQIKDGAKEGTLTVVR